MIFWNLIRALCGLHSGTQSARPEVVDPDEDNSMLADIVRLLQEHVPPDHDPK